MKTIRIVFLLLLCCVLTGCQGGADAGASGKTKYRYEEADVVGQISVSEAVYKEGELRLSVTGKIDGDYNVIAYDSAFNRIESEWSVSYEKGVLTIRGDGAERISGLELENGFFQYELRYLDSEQYAVLCYAWAEDAGMILIEGDRNLYLTKEEIEEEAARQRAYMEQQRANWELMIGTWVSEEDEAQEISFYEENGRHRFRYPAQQDGTVTEQIANADKIEILEKEGADRTLSIYDGITWGCRYDAEISDEADYLIWEGVKYRKVQ